MSIVIDGRVIDPKIVPKLQVALEKGSMPLVRGIILHQTKSATAEATFNSYRTGLNGAHFLIDKDGTIYQTARVDKKTWHAGKLRARCIVELRCKAAKWNPKATHEQEMKKPWPERYPSNEDSIGIELVGEFLSTNAYIGVTDQQNASLRWLVADLERTLGLSTKEVFRHPTVSYKEPSEASTAVWQ